MTEVGQLVLFAECALPGCRNQSDSPASPCPQCVAEFGPMLRQVATDLSEADLVAALAERDEAVRAIYRERVGAVPLPEPGPEPLPGREEKRNQLCWCCEERRTCRRDLDDPDRWICKSCEAVE